MTVLDKGEYRLPDGRTKLKAHDIRHMCACPYCAGAADDRDAIHWMDQKYHPACFYRAFGRQTVVERLPRSEQMKFRLSDLPLVVMKILIQYMENEGRK